MPCYLLLHNLLISLKTRELSGMLTSAKKRKIPGSGSIKFSYSLLNTYTRHFTLFLYIVYEFGFQASIH